MHIISSLVDLIIINSDQIFPFQYAKKREMRMQFSIKNRQSSVDAMLAPGVVELVLMTLPHCLYSIFIISIFFVLYLVVFDDLLQGRLHLHFLQLGPAEVGTREKLVVLHLFPRTRAQPLLGLELQQAADEVFQLFAQVFVDPTPVTLRVLHQSFHLPAVIDLRAGEGRRVVRDLICQNAQGPQIDLLSVALLEDHLRCVVHHRSRFCLGQLVLLQFFSQAKVSQLHISIIEDQHVLRFQIPIDYILRMQVLNSQDNAGQDEANSVLPSPPKILHAVAFLIDQRQNVSSLCPLHHKIEVLGVSQGVVERCNEVT